MARTNTDLTTDGWFDLITGVVTIPGPRMAPPSSDTAVRCELSRESVGDAWEPASGAICAEAAYKDAKPAVRDMAFAVVTAVVASGRKRALLHTEDEEAAAMLDLVLDPIKPEPASVNAVETKPEPEPEPKPEPKPASTASRRRRTKASD